MDYIITHYPDNKRFETQVDGVVAFVQYRLSGDKLDIIHRASCSFAVTWLHRHPDYAG